MKPIESNPVKTTGPSRQRGFDTGKKVKGRKRHIAVDTLGNLPAVCVHSAGIQDRRGARLLMIRRYAMFAALGVIWADGGYSGVLVEWAKNMFNWNLIIVKRTDAMRGKSVVLPRRWVVERSFAWLGNSRRLSKDYERLPDRPRYLSKLPRYTAFYAEFVRFLNSFLGFLLLCIVQAKLLFLWGSTLFYKLYYNRLH